MFNYHDIEEENKGSAIYRCRLVAFDKSIRKIFNRELESGGGWIPTSQNPDWHFPVVQYPGNFPEHGQPCYVVFAREARQDGNGIRNIVRIYALESRKKPQYWLDAVYVKGVAAAWPLLGEKNNCRFAVTGYTVNNGIMENLRGQKDYAIIGVAMSSRGIVVRVKDIGGNII